MSSEVTDIRAAVTAAPSPLSQLWLESGGTDLVTQVMHPDGTGHKRINGGLDSDYPLRGQVAKVGTTWRNWVDGRTVAIAFDIDHADDHKNGFTTEEIDDAIDRLPDYALAYRSRRGKGITVIVPIDAPAPDDASHKHTAERVKLQLAADRFPVHRLDVFGGNSWVWAAEKHERGHTLIRAAIRTLTIDELPELPPRPPVPVVNDVSTVEFEPEHHRQLEEWSSRGYVVTTTILPDGRKCVLLHTKALPVPTKSAGTDPRTPNAFAFPIAGGGWAVYRFNKVAECHPWFTTANGETCCLIGVTDVEAVAKQRLRFYDGAYLGTVREIAATLPTPIDIAGIEDQPAELKSDSRGLVIVTDGRKVKPPTGWLAKGYKLLFFVDGPRENASLDGLVYCGERYGEASEWFTFIDGQLIARSKDDCRSALLHRHKERAVTKAICRAAANPTPIVKVPFKPPIHDGKLNPAAPQIAFTPSPGEFPTWLAVCRHTGVSLNEALSTGWGAQHGVDGCRYIIAWIANSIRDPACRLPMLCMFGHQLAAKSTFAEALQILVPNGVYRIAKQLRSKDKFDSNLEGCPFVFADEVDLSNQSTFEYLKSWITDTTATVRAMYRTTYRVTNYSHWLQGVNRVEHLPVFDDVSRLTVLHLRTIPPEQRIAWPALKAQLAAEAPAFLHHLLTMDLPPGDSRTALPMIATDTKEIARAMTDDPLNALVKRVVAECCQPGPDCKLTDFTSKVNELSDVHHPQRAVIAALTNCQIPIRRLDGYYFVIGVSLKP